MGVSGRVPHRVDAATKTGLLALLDDAVEEGWTLRRASRTLELGEARAHRWITRRSTPATTTAQSTSPPTTTPGRSCSRLATTGPR